MTETTEQARIEHAGERPPGAGAAVLGDGAAAEAARVVISQGGWESGMAEVVVLVCDSVGAASVELGTLGPSGERPAVLLICPRLRPGELRTALASGFAGVVLADELEAALLPSLAAVAAGQVCVPRSQARQVDAAALSAREKQILGLVVMGYMNGEIATQLFVAESTVKSHLSSAFSKLGVRSRNEAVELILDPDRGLGMGILGLGGEPIEPLAEGPA